MKRTWILGIDPGPRESAYCRLHDLKPYQVGKVYNDELLRLMRQDDLLLGISSVVIETIFPRGQAVGLETMQTQLWAGRFAQVADSNNTPWHQIDRQDVRFAICGSLDTRDSSVRQALIDYYGGMGGKAAAIGTKAKPGPLYGITADMWAALAIALAWQLKQKHQQPISGATR